MKRSILFKLFNNEGEGGCHFKSDLRLRAKVVLVVEVEVDHEHIAELYPLLIIKLIYFRI